MTIIVGSIVNMIEGPKGSDNEHENLQFDNYERSYDLQNL